MTTPSAKDISAEWNRNAEARCNQIETGKDISHDKVLLPAILRLAGRLDGMAVLDVGCGCGFLAGRIARRADRVLGIDISERMIEQASSRNQRSKLSFRCISVQALARFNELHFDLCVANMSVMTMPNLMGALRAVRTLLDKSGVFIFSITHPCFWNIYRKDEPSKRFDYWRGHAVTAPFRITLDQKPLPALTTYFHRPLSEYVLSVRRAGFVLEDLVEPKPPRTTSSAYRRVFPFPRFLVMHVRKLDGLNVK